jgi:hypothetical protein
MFGALCRQREAIVAQLVSATTAMMAEVDPKGERDHRSHWDATVASRRTKPDIFDRVRYGVDELVVLQMAHCGDFHETCIDATLVRLARLVEAETVPLERLERDVPAVQLYRRWFPDLNASTLPVAVRAMRKQHTLASSLCELLDHLEAA